MCPIVDKVPMGHYPAFPTRRYKTAHTFDLPSRRKRRGWRVKVRGWERVEPPHVTVMRKTRAWRFGLRELDLLDDSPDPSAGTSEGGAHLRRRSVRCEVARAWDAMYPHNPVYDDCDDSDD